MGESKIFNKIGTLKVKNGTYKKDGVEKNRYHEVGVLLSSPHGSQLLIKLHATATTEPKLISVFKDDDVEFSLTRTEKQEEEVVPKDIPEGEVSFDEIPF